MEKITFTHGDESNLQACHQQTFIIQVIMQHADAALCRDHTHVIKPQFAVTAICDCQFLIWCNVPCCSKPVDKLLVVDSVVEVGLLAVVEERGCTECQQRTPVSANKEIILQHTVSAVHTTIHYLVSMWNFQP